MVDINVDGGLTPEDITKQLQEGVLKNAVQEQPKKQEESNVEDASQASLRDGNREDQSESQEVHQEERVLENDSFEAEAAAKGWKEGGTKSAEEFLRAEPLYEEIKTRGKEIKELKATLDELKAHMHKQQASETDRMRTAVEQARLDAIELGDVNGVNEADKQLREFEQSNGSQSQVDPNVQSFLDRNQSWLNDPSYEGQQMRNFAHQRDQELIAFNLSAEEQMRVIEKDLKSKFPSQFEGSSSSSQSVESDVAPTMNHRSKKKHSFKDLNPEQKKAARHFEKRNVMTVDAYIKSLVQSGEL